MAGMEGKRRYAVATHMNGEPGPWFLPLTDTNSWAGPTIDLAPFELVNLERLVRERNAADCQIASKMRQQVYPEPVDE